MLVSKDSVRSVLKELAEDDDFVTMVWQFLGIKVDRAGPPMDGGCFSFDSFLESWQTEEVEIEAFHVKCSALRLFGKQVPLCTCQAFRCLCRVPRQL